MGSGQFAKAPEALEEGFARSASFAMQDANCPDPRHPDFCSLSIRSWRRRLACDLDRNCDGSGCFLCPGLRSICKGFGRPGRMLGSIRASLRNARCKLVRVPDAGFWFFGLSECWGLRRRLERMEKLGSGGVWLWFY
jgi:hypothetical protein